MLNSRRTLTKKLKMIITLGLGGATAFNGIGIWTGNEKFFEEILVPILDRADPEMTHRIAVTISKYHLTRPAPAENSTNLKTRLGTLELSNPIGIAAGFDKSGECISGIMRMGFGWAEIGSVTPFPQEGNPKPRVFRLPKDSAVINRYGFNNDGHEKVYNRILAFKLKNPEYPVGVNLGANKDSPNRIKDYCKGIERFSNLADYFVINISSPNTPNLRDLQKYENLTDLLKEVLKSRDKQVKKVPLFLKVAPDLIDSEVSTISKAVKSKGDSRIDGLIISNTTITREHLLSSESLRNETGGLSGKPLAEVSTTLIQKFYKELNGEVKIIGVGGIWNGKDAYEKICSGANAVQIYTALTYRGPGLVAKVKDELSSLLA